MLTHIHIQSIQWRTLVLDKRTLNAIIIMWFFFLTIEKKEFCVEIGNCTGLLAGLRIENCLSVAFFGPIYTACGVIRWEKLCRGRFGKRVYCKLPHVIWQSRQPAASPVYCECTQARPTRSRRRRRRRRSAANTRRLDPNRIGDGCFAHLLIALRFKLIKITLSVIV